MKFFTNEQVLDALEAVVLNREDYVDQRAQDGLICKYQIGGKASCIVGQVLSRLGVPVDVLDAMDRGGEPAFGDDGNVILLQAGFEVTEAASVALQDAQSVQDNKGNWGDALNAARVVLVKQ